MLVQRLLTDYDAVLVGVEKVPRDELTPYGIKLVREALFWKSQAFQASLTSKTDSHAPLAFVRLDGLDRVGP